MALPSESYRAWKLECHESHLPFDVEGWYLLLEEVTAPSEFLPLSKAMELSFVHFYQMRYNNRQVFTTEDQKALQLLMGQVESVLRRFPEAFVRLSSRSPKDGNVLNSIDLVPQYKSTLEELTRCYPPKSDLEKTNLSVVAIAQIQAKMLRVCSTREVLHLLLSSERVFTDLLSAEAAGKSGQSNLIIRK